MSVHCTDLYWPDRDEDEAEVADVHGAVVDFVNRNA